LALEDTVELANKAIDQWPGPAGQSVKFEDAPPGLWELVRRRDMASDSVKIYAATAVEAFLNFYAVVRMTEAGFTKAFEQPGLKKKTELILEACDSVTAPISTKICEIADRLATRRRLMHPKTKELKDTPTTEEKAADKIPEIAQAAYADMLEFFAEFITLVPNARMHVPDEVEVRLKEIGKWPDNQ
jgi:hypothetical protein